MIYTKWGERVEPIAYCGKHTPKGFGTQLVLLKVRHDDGEERYQFAVWLKADGGINEIDTAVDALSEVELSGEELKAAIRQAE